MGSEAESSLPNSFLATKTKWQLALDPNLERFKVIKHHGKISQTIGHCIESRLFLTLSEGLYLLENDRAHLFLEQELISIEKYDEWLRNLLANEFIRAKTYCRLKNAGYILNSVDTEYWDLHSPNASYKKSRPTTSAGKLVFVDAHENLFDSLERAEASFENTGAIFSIADGGSLLMMATEWVFL